MDSPRAGSKAEKAWHSYGGHNAQSQKTSQNHKLAASFPCGGFLSGIVPKRMVFEIISNKTAGASGASSKGNCGCGIGTVAVVWENYSLASDRAKSVHGRV